MENKKVKVSALNLVPQFQGEATIDAINRAVELGKILENLDYHRYWVAEHHNFRGVVSSASWSRWGNVTKPFSFTSS